MLKLMYKPPPILGQRNIQMHVAHGCNLTCQSCSHYTNTGGGKLLDLIDAIDWMKPWCERIVPDFFILIGGEPTLNKKLTDIAIAAAKMWKYSKIKIVTNGFFLDKHPHLPQAMKDYDLHIEISIKSNAPEYDEKIKPIKNIVQEWLAKEPKLHIKYRNDYTHWIKIYHGYGPNIMPYQDNDPKTSFQNCGFKICKVLHETALWKCPRLAFLKLHNQKFPLHENWNPYLNYQPLKPNCTWRELVNFYTEETIPECAMCPAKIEYMNLPSPLIPAKELINASYQKRI